MWSAFANINWKAMLIPLALGSVVVGVIVLLMLFGTPVLHAFPLSVKMMEEMMRSQFIQLVQIHYTEQHLWY